LSEKQAHLRVCIRHVRHNKLVDHSEEASRGKCSGVTLGCCSNRVNTIQHVSNSLRVGQNVRRLQERNHGAVESTGDEFGVCTEELEEPQESFAKLGLIAAGRCAK
jgi:hypothetical protein